MDPGKLVGSGAKNHWRNGGKKDIANLVAKKCLPSKLPVSPERNPGGMRSADIQACLESLRGAILQQIEEILSQAHDSNRQMKEAVAEAILVTKKEAAGLMRTSIPTLDRLVKSGEIEVTYLTPRSPRFRLTEIVRFQAAHTRAARQGRRQQGAPTGLRHKATKALQL